MIKKIASPTISQKVQKMKFHSLGIDQSGIVCRITKLYSNHALLPSLVIKFIGIRKSQVLRCFACEKEQVVKSKQVSNNDISKICKISQFWS